MVLRQSLFILVVSLLCVFLQATFFGTFFPRWLIPNLCLIVIIFLGIFESNPRGAILAFLVGTFLDMASAPLIGPWAGSFVAIFGILSQGGRKLFVDSNLAICLISLVCALISQIIYFFLLSQFQFNWDQLISLILFGSTIITGIFAPFLFRILVNFYPKDRLGGRYVQQRLF